MNGERLAAVLMVAVVLMFGAGITGAEEALEPGQDRGYTIHGPHVKTVFRPINDSLILARNTQQGVTVTENPASPFHDARWVYRGSTIQKNDGSELGEAGVMEFTDPDGDVVFVPVVNWYYEGAESYWWVVEGTGKWHGITGKIWPTGMRKDRKDDGWMVNFGAEWKIDPDAGVPDSAELKKKFAKHEAIRALVHPTAKESETVWKKGSVVGVYTMSGVLLSDDETSPFRNASVFLQGLEFHDADGNALPLTTVWAMESTDADGDAVFMSLDNRQGGPQRILIIGGTGKWAGISGEGRVKGAEPRGDDLEFFNLGII